MASDNIYLKDVFIDIMSNVRDNYDPLPDSPTNAQIAAQKPYFLYGRKHEILKLLTEKDTSPVWKNQKFPLVILYHSQPESHSPGDYLLDYTVSPTVSIVMDSSPDWLTIDENGNTDSRYTKNIETILYPIKNLLLKYMAESYAFQQSYVDEIEHEITVWDGNPADNTDAGIIFNEYLDGINIEFNNLEVFKTATPC